jgi:hypothetical protein
MTQSTNDPGPAVLEAVADTYCRVYRITDGTDEDWASWYAVQRTPVRSSARQHPPAQE